jgi:hypothetical protein
MLPTMAAGIPIVLRLTAQRAMAEAEMAAAMEDGGPVVLDRDGQAKGLHADVVHGPDADAHDEGSARKPGETGRSASGSDTAGEVERGVGSEDRDDDGDCDEMVVVLTDERWCVHVHKFPLECLVDLIGGAVGSISDWGMFDTVGTIR